MQIASATVATATAAHCTASSAWACGCGSASRADLPPHAAHGLFARPGDHDVLVRLSNGGSRPRQGLHRRRSRLRASRSSVVHGPGALGVDTSAARTSCSSTSRCSASAAPTSSSGSSSASAMGRRQLVGYMIGPLRRVRRHREAQGHGSRTRPTVHRVRHRAVLLRGADRLRPVRRPRPPGCRSPPRRRARTRARTGPPTSPRGCKPASAAARPAAAVLHRRGHHARSRTPRSTGRRPTSRSARLTDPAVADLTLRPGRGDAGRGRGGRVRPLVGARRAPAARPDHAGDARPPTVPRSSGAGLS